MSIGVRGRKILWNSISMGKNSAQMRQIAFPRTQISKFLRAWGLVPSWLTSKIFYLALFPQKSMSKPTTRDM